MKSKILLLFLLLTGGILSAQDTVRTLIFSEIRMNNLSTFYAELTKVGAEPVQMGNFKFCCVTAWGKPWFEHGSFWLPNKILMPGKM